MPNDSFDANELNFLASFTPVTESNASHPEETSYTHRDKTYTFVRSLVDAGEGSGSRHTVGLYTYNDALYVIKRGAAAANDPQAALCYTRERDNCRTLNEKGYSTGFIAADDTNNTLIFEYKGATLKEILDHLNNNSSHQYDFDANAFKKKIARALIKKLSALHKEQYIHTDLKPENIVIDARGELSLIDYEGAVSASNERDGATSVENRIHTRAYSAHDSEYPDEDQTYSDDVSSLGVILSTFKFNKQSLESILSAHLNATRVTDREKRLPLECIDAFFSLEEKVASEVGAILSSYNHKNWETLAYIAREISFTSPNNYMITVESNQWLCINGVRICSEAKEVIQTLRPEIRLLSAPDFTEINAIATDTNKYSAFRNRKTCLSSFFDAMERADNYAKVMHNRGDDEEVVKTYKCSQSTLMEHATIYLLSGSPPENLADDIENKVIAPVKTHQDPLRMRLLGQALTALVCVFIFYPVLQFLEAQRLRSELSLHSEKPKMTWMKACKLANAPRRKKTLYSVASCLQNDISKAHTVECSA